MSKRISPISAAIRHWRRWLTEGASLAFLLGLVAFGQQAILKGQDSQRGAVPSASAPMLPGVASSSSLPPSSEEYLINPGDVLDVYVYDVPELSHTYVVSPSGVITMPLLSEPVQVQGLTPDQIARALQQAYRQSGRLKRPEIAVSLKQAPASTIAVEGAVRNPLILPEVARARLVDILVQCGGLADDAGTYATITRGPLAMRALAKESGPATPTLTVEVKKVMDVTDPASTIDVWPGDRVLVERQQPDVYYVMGEVNRPGGYTLQKGREELTVMRALAIAGDQTGVAKMSRAVLIRRDMKAPLGREEIKLDLKKIITGHSPDPKLQADDILFVPGSNGKKALRTIENTPGYIVGAAGSAAVVAH